MYSQEATNNNTTPERGHPEQEEFQLLSKTRRRRIIAAVESNNLEELKSILTESKLYSIKDDFGYCLLQIAISRRNKAIFDFLLSFERYPFDPDDDGVATLKMTFSSDSTEYFAIKLIENGADIHAIFDENQNTFLHQAVKIRFTDAAELLIKKGVDINSQNLRGYTPLSTLVEHGLFVQLPFLDNFVSMLLYYGADATICDSRGKKPMEFALNAGHFDEHVLNILENLIFHTVDGYSDYELPVDVLFSLFNVNNGNNSRFHQILDLLSHLKLDTDGLKPCQVSFHAVFLFFVELESLQLLMHKFPLALSQILCITSRKTKIEEYFFNSNTIKNFSLMLESDLCCDTIEFIGKIRIADLIDEGNLDGIIELIYYLLTYGLPVYEEDLEMVYKTFGYCELFKILLHMDIGQKYAIQRDIMPAIIYDMSMDIDKFLEDPHNYSLKSLYDLLDYFALPKLKLLCYRLNIERLVAKASSLPQVPRLVELARNASRKFLIEKCNARTSKEFHTMIKWLPISEVYKRCISFESKLYK